MTDRVRVGADWNGVTMESEVTRIDFDTVYGVMCICVEHLSTRGTTIVEMWPERAPHNRQRIGNFPTRLDDPCTVTMEDDEVVVRVTKDVLVRFA